MTDLTRLKVTQFSGMIKTYQRVIKQSCGIERCQARSATAQRKHLALA